jgi:hypothetical protein
MHVSSHNNMPYNRKPCQNTQMMPGGVGSDALEAKSDACNKTKHTGSTKTR